MNWLKKRVDGVADRLSRLFSPNAFRLDCRCCGRELEKPGGVGFFPCGMGFCPVCRGRILRSVR